MDYKEYKRKALEPIVNYIESVLASYSKEELEARIKEALPKKESEDERIKRFILTSLNYLIGVENSPGSDYDKQLKEAYSWLEKQKEQKPEIEIYTRTKSKSFMEPYMKGWNDAMEAIKKEHKPAEWSDEDEEMIKTIDRALLKASAGFGLGAIRCPYDDARDWIKSLRPQPKQERKIKEGDKVIIHCRKDRKEGVITIFDGKVGEVIHVWDAERNPWGHIGVRLDNGCNDGFHEDELEVFGEPHWKPSEEQMKALGIAIRCGIQLGTWEEDALRSLNDELKSL